MVREFHRFTEVVLSCIVDDHAAIHAADQTDQCADGTQPCTVALQPVEHGGTNEKTERCKHQRNAPKEIAVLCPHIGLKISVLVNRGRFTALTVWRRQKGLNLLVGQPVVVHLPVLPPHAGDDD